MAGGLGFEPRLVESESTVLPLDDPPLKSDARIRIQDKSISVVRHGKTANQPLDHFYYVDRFGYIFCSPLLVKKSDLATNV